MHIQSLQLGVDYLPFNLLLKAYSVLTVDSRLLTL